ncbi:hypothetical protein MBLNU13_g05256t1 [Cladosporium sp. NU13]
MESFADNNFLNYDMSITYTATEAEAISQLTAELFCNDDLKPLYLAAVLDDDIGTDKLYEQLRHDLKSLGIFFKAEDKSLWKFAEALQEETISNGIARAIVNYAQEVFRREDAVDEDLVIGSLALTEEHEPAGDAPSSTAESRTNPAHPTFHLDTSTAHLILDLGAYTTFTPPPIHRILHSTRYLSIHSHLLDLLFSAYSHRLATAIGPAALGEDGEILRWSRLQTTIDELSRTPPHKISYAAHGTKVADVSWTSPSGEHKFKALELMEGFCRVKWTSTEGYVRFVDVRVGIVKEFKEAVWSAPAVGGFVR